MAGEPYSASSSPRLPLHRAVSETSGGRIYGSGRHTLDDGGVDASGETVGRKAEAEGMKTAARQHSSSGNRGGESVASTPPATPGDEGAAAAGPTLLTPASRNSVGSRSFESLQGLASTSSPDAAGTTAAADATGGDDGDCGSDGSGTGEIEGNRSRASSRHGQQRRAAAGLRRRGMSTTDAAVFDTRSSTVGRFSNRASVGGGGVGSGGSGRVRSWTGGEEAVLNSVIGNRSSGRVGRAGERSRGGLQRISPLWDTDQDGSLSQMPVPFDRVGRRWSRTFNVDAAKTGGPLETSGGTLGVSVSALTGQFHRTRVVTLYPRLIVRNYLGFPLEVWCDFGACPVVCCCCCC